MKRNTFVVLLIVISLIGAFLRWLGIDFIGVDLEHQLLEWYDELTVAGSLKGLATFSGDYNMPYMGWFYLFTKLPFSPVINIKLSSIVFDYLLAVVVLLFVMEYVQTEKKYLYGCVAYAVVLWSPIVIVNSAYLGQCESVWAAPGLLGLWLLHKRHPVWGMFAVGVAIAMKPQGIFILPIVILYYAVEKSFSLLHFLWIPVAIQLLCIPAFIGGCDFFIFYRIYMRMLSCYPHVYYYYPNIWTFIKNAPFYIFGKVGTFSAFAVLLVVALLFVKREKYLLKDYILFCAWTAMTCVMILPSMHERYNYLAEVLLPVVAITDRKYRLPAIGLVLVSLLCNGQSYLGWGQFSHYFLAVCNILIYAYLAKECIKMLFDAGEKEEVRV